MPTQAPISHHLDLYDYWLGRRGARTMPARPDLNPGDIPSLLPYLMIVEKAGDQFRYRLVGSAIVREVGHDATGSFAGSYFADPKDAAEARAIWERVFTAAHPIFATGEFCFKSGVNHSMSMLELPLSDDGMTVAPMAPATWPSATTGRPPCISMKPTPANQSGLCGSVSPSVRNSGISAA